MAVTVGSSTVRFSFEGFGFTQVAREFRHKGEHVDDVSPALHVINEEITGILAEQFASEGSAGGNRWAELAESTVAYKRSHDLRSEILRATDRLMGSLVDPYHEDAMVMVEPHMLVRGSHVAYGPYHQRGHDAPTPLPQRKIFNFASMHRRNIVKILQRFIMTGEV